MQASVPRVVVMTMVRDEADLLPRWIDYYGGQVGPQNLVVLDDNSVDGSTDDLPCLRYRLPPEPWKQRWSKMRVRMANKLAEAFLACNDVVVFTDVDEFLIPDPEKHGGLLDYLTHRPDTQVMAPLAFELMHNARIEPPLDPARPVLEQRRFVKFAPAMCKPLLKRVPAAWEPAFHGIHAPFEVDPELFMLHLKWCDEAVLARVGDQRHQIRTEEGRGSPRSFWAKRPDQLLDKLAAWTGPADRTGSAPVLDVHQLDYEGLIGRRLDDSWRSRANQTTALNKTDLRELPERFRAAF